MRELFIYYRSPRDSAARVQAGVREFQARLAQAHPGLVARLMCRPVAVDGVDTWMETYSMDPTHSALGVEPALEREIEQQAACLAPLLIGPRHVEVFTACA
jgi:hypothetical protein